MPTPAKLNAVEGGVAAKPMSELVTFKIKEDKNKFGNYVEISQQMMMGMAGEAKGLQYVRISFNTISYQGKV